MTSKKRPSRVVENNRNWKREEVEKNLVGELAEESFVLNTKPIHSINTSLSKLCVGVSHKAAGNEKGHSKGESFKLSSAEVA